MFFKNLVVLFLWTNVASALEGLRVILPITANIDMKRIVDAGFMRKSYWDECRLLRGERENNTPALLETLYIGIGGRYIVIVRFYDKIMYCHKLAFHTEIKQPHKFTHVVCGLWKKVIIRSTLNKGLPLTLSYLEIYLTSSSFG